VRTTGTLRPLPVPISRITFNPETRCYGFAFNFPGRRVHHAIETMEFLERAMRWADPWNERIWEEPSDADEGALLISRRKRPGAL
jgi:hypothetical protein